MYYYTILKDVAEIGQQGKALKVIQWGERAAKLDLRMWRKDGEELKPGKGLTLTKEEAKELAEALQEYLAG